MKRRAITVVDAPEIELVHCPWCKTKPSILTEIDEYNVECINENCLMVVRTQWMTNMKDAVTLWNRAVS